MKQLLYFITGAALLVLAAAGARAQNSIKAYFTADNEQPQTGQPVTLTLTAEVPQDIEIVEWPQIGLYWSPFQVLETGDVQVRQNGRFLIYQQQFTVVLWQAGSFETPQTLIGYKLPVPESTAEATPEATVEAAEATEVPTPVDTTLYAPVVPAYFTVPSVLTGVDDTLHPLKPLIYLPYLPVWAILLASAGLGGAGYFGYRRYQGWKAEAALRALGSANTPALKALSRLAALGKEKLTAEEMYPRVADCLREYVQQRFDVPAQELTSAELVSRLRSYPNFPGQLCSELNKLLDQADLVKFARFRPADRHIGRLLNFARNWIHAAERAVGGEADE